MVFRSQTARQPKVQPFSVPGPIGGWNTRDALDAMEGTDAVLLDNWFPETGKVTVRKGRTAHATGMGSGNVDLISSYRTGAVKKIITGANGNLYDATATGAATSLKSGFTSNQWQWSNFNALIFFTNGVDTPQKFDNTTMVDWGFTGPTATDIKGVHVFKNRLFFWENTSADFWFGALDAVSGALTSFPLSRVARQGGTLLMMATWTIDGGEGKDDFAVFILDTGQVVVYAGLDPAIATDWQLVGIYDIPAPINIRGWVKVGGDLMITTVQDYISLSQVLKSGAAPSKLSGAIAAAADPSLFGWASILFKEKVLFNVPNTDGTLDQHVVNRSTGAACRFKGFSARSWVVHDNDLYFGSTDGTTSKAESGDDDDGAAIDADGQQAWNDFEIPQRKRPVLTRPMIQSVGTIDYEYGLGFDFRDVTVGPASSAVTIGEAWDVAEWDVAEWGGSTIVDTTWRVAAGSGFVISTRIRVSALQEISWLRTDYRYEAGANL